MRNLNHIGDPYERQTRQTYRPHTFTGRIIIKRQKHNELYSVHIEPGIFACDNVPSLDSRLDCGSKYDLDTTLEVFIDTTDFIGWNIDDRPVPSVVFNYKVNTNIEANPIPSLRAVWGIS